MKSPAPLKPTPAAAAEYAEYVELEELEALGGGAAGARRRAFALAYVADPRRCASQAYARVYGLSNAAASAACASRLLRSAKVSRAVAALEARLRDTALPRMLRRLEAIIHTDLREVMAWDGQGRVRLIPSADLSPAASAALAEVRDVREERQGRLDFGDGDDEAAVVAIRRSVRLHDPLKAMELYARLAGLGAAERVEISPRVVVVRQMPEMPGADDPAEAA